MKKADVKIGETYYAKVTHKRVEVRLEAEKPNGGWMATNLATGKKVTIKTAQRLTPIPVKATKPKTSNAKPDNGSKPLSCIAAALKVLGESKEPMNAKEMIEAMEAKKYWTSPGGKTPQATLYSAILRDLAKADDARFVKTERGRFTIAK